MKNILKAAIIAITSIAFCTALQAQSHYKTDESIREQIKKGAVPGQQFAPVTTQLQQKKEQPDPNAAVREKFSARLKNSGLPGMKVSTGGAAFKGGAPVIQKTGNVALASETPAKKQEKAPAVKPVTLPTQDAPASKQ